MYMKIRLHMNENFFLEREWLMKIIARVLDDIDPRVYPEPFSEDVRASLAEFYGVSPDNVVVGAGGEHIIELVTKTFGRGHRVLTVTPSFPLFDKYANMYGRGVERVPLSEGFDLPVDEIVRAAKRGDVSLVMIDSPNNPTGRQFDEDKVRDLVEKLNERNVIVLLDEAYADFGRYSALPLVLEFSNLVILKTFSKSFGLAGLRIGAAIASKNLADKLLENLPPYAVDVVSQRALKAVIENHDYVAKKINELRRERSRVFSKLKEIDQIDVFPSDANFHMIRLKSMRSSEVCSALAVRGILVKDLTEVFGTEEYIRVTVGTPSMNDEFLATLKNILTST